MFKILILLCVIVCAVDSLSEVEGAEAKVCNTWYYVPANKSQCVCGQTLNGALLCSEKDQRVFLNVEYCMSQTNSGELLAGRCRYGYYQCNSSQVKNRIFSLLPQSPKDLDKVLCGPHNRKGLLCGECIKGYGPSVYSFKYTFACSDCSEMSTFQATALYLTLELAPMTILFFVIMIFRVHITTGPMFGYVIFCQMQVQSAHLYLPLQSSALSYLAESAKIVYYLFQTLAGIWTLDFFKVGHIIPPFCISDRITDLRALWFDYVQVVYTLALVFFTYACIELYSHNYRLIVFLWRPFLRPCIRIRRQWNSNGSIIHAYATLLILMFVRLNIVFVDLHKKTSLYNQTKFEAEVLMINPQMKLYSSEHIASLLLSSTILFVFGFCPALFLCLYPTRLFSRATTHCCSARKRIAMSVFSDTLQGCYKDGLNGTRDYRMTPAIIMLLALTYSVSVGLLFGKLDNWNNVLFESMLSIFMAVTVAYLKPCKNWIMNLSLCFHLSIWCALTLLFNAWGTDFFASAIMLAYTSLILLSVPHVLMLLWGSYKLIRFVRTYTHNIHLSLYP